MAPRKSTSEAKEKEVNWAIKKLDAAPLLRADIQWEVLDLLFNDRTFRYTAPVDKASEPAAPVYLNFDQLYLEAILSSLKMTQNLRTKLIENPAFAISFCKLCLLINVGRINTTLAFWPSMKTALRTYHPVPSLQADPISQTEMQDAPRIKGMLKACFLDWEVTEQPLHLRDIAKKAASSQPFRGPPTTVVTALFHLFSEASWASEKYFPPGFDLHDLFYPSSMPSAPRATAFLSLLHRILETPTFLADFDTPTPPPIALSPPIALVRFDPNLLPENVDTPEELQFAKEMKELRESIVKTVPAIVEREKQLSARVRQKDEKDKEKDKEEPGEPAKKKRRTDEASGRSFARYTHDEGMRNVVPEILPRGWENEDWSSNIPARSSLPLTWHNIKTDLSTSHDPDYDSDEDSAWSYDLLLRRAQLTIVNPATGVRGPPSEIKEFEEWGRRRREGFVEEEVAYPGEEMEVERASNMGEEED